MTLNPAEEILEITDENDNVIGRAPRAEIHERGLIHRAVHIFVFDGEGRIYVQRRSASKDRHPLKLDSSAAGHVDPGESYKEAGLRELVEELAVEAPLTDVLKIPACPLTDNEHVVLFETVSRTMPNPNPEEIVDGEFMTPVELTRRMQADPDDFVPAFILLWEKYLETKQ
jgi:isopentenyl-diphosphate Delta-isomerase